MNSGKSRGPGDATEEVFALVEVLRETEQRIEELTAGGVDSVSDRDGRMFLLRRARADIEISERRSNQVALAQSKAGLHRAELMAKLAHVITGPDGSFEKWSETLPKLIGVAPGQLPRTTRAWLDILHPDDRSLFRDKAIEASVTKLHTELEYRLRKGDGEWIHVRQCMEPLEREGAASARFQWFNTLQDVTAERRTEESLRDSESRFRQMAENIRDVFFLVDVESNRRLYVSPAYEQIWGRSLEGDYSDPNLWIESIHPDDRVAISENYKKGLLAGQFDYEYRIVRPDGSIRWIQSRGFPVRDEAGKLYRIAGISEDITDRKEAENRIRRLNRVYAVLSGINSLIVRVRDRDELFREACRIAVQSGQFLLAWVAVADPRDQVVKAVAWAGDEHGFVQLTRPTVGAKGQGKAGLGAQAIERRIPAICNDIEADGSAMRYPKGALERGYRSAAALPLVVNGTAIGALVLYAAEAGFFDDEETKLLVELAGDISFALEHIDKEEKVRRLTRVHAVLSGINALIVRAQDRDELFREACRIAVEDGEFLMAWIGFVDRSAMRIVPIASAGADAGFLDEIRVRLSLLDDAPAGHGLAAMAVREKQAVIVNDVVADPRIRSKNAHADRGIRSVVSLPLLIADEPVAVFGLHAAEAGYFDEAEMKLLRELAGDISFAINHIDKQERLDYLAYYDALTGLANRSLFLERVAQYMRSAASEGHKLALFLIDLERFKSINDSLGRTTGDALLRQVAEWLTHNVGDASLLARVGADHFAVVLPEVKQEGNVVRLVEKTIEAFLEHPFRLNDSVYRIAFKVGGAVFPEDGANADTLFKHAETALKKAKASGERYLFYTQKMTEAVAGKLTLENQLRQALDKEEFVLHYQPKVSLQSGKLTGAEALIRWNDPHTGLVPPGRFIPVLEETGLIHEVGRWALRKAIEDYLRWRTAGLAAVRISVNVSPLQLRNRGFIAEIEQVIGIDAHAAAGLELEITESLIMEDVQHNIASLQSIRAMGVTIAIDDFGTGFSSLSYLAKLPVDTLKIDRMFVNEMTAAPEGLALVSTIITLAHSLKLKVVAEGVETEEQSRLLRSLSCDEMQGFLFSKPVPCEIFETRFLAPPHDDIRTT